MIEGGVRYPLSSIAACRYRAHVDAATSHLPSNLHPASLKATYTLSKLQLFLSSSSCQSARISSTMLESTRR